MDLKEFTKQTLLQIVSGVNEANQELEKLGASIPTYNVKNSKRYIETNDGCRDVVDLDFDVAVTASDISGKEGGGGLKVASLNLGGKVESKTENQTISRVKFSLPLVLPIVGEEVDEHNGLYL